MVVVVARSEVQCLRVYGLFVVGVGCGPRAVLNTFAAATLGSGDTLAHEYQ